MFHLVTHPSTTARNDPVAHLQKRLDSGAAKQLLRYLVFSNEASLKGLGFEDETGSKFARDFASRGPRDRQGRSLREFDLKEHTFRYPLSYLIYTESFDNIPEPAKGYLYHRLLQVLTNEDQDAEFAAISPQAKRAALEILLATKRGLPDEWRAYATTNRLHVAVASPRTRHTRGSILHAVPASS